MPDPRGIGDRAKSDIRLAAGETEFLVERFERENRLLEDVVLIYLEYGFLGLDQMPVKRPKTRDVPPYIIVEEARDLGTGEIVDYNYDLVDAAYDDYVGIHLHGHGGPAKPHVHATTHGLKTRLEEGEQSKSIRLEDALRALIERCMANRVGPG